MDQECRLQEAYAELGHAAELWSYPLLAKVSKAAIFRILDDLDIKPRKIGHCCGRRDTRIWREDAQRAGGLQQKVQGFVAAFNANRKANVERVAIANHP